VRIGVRVEGVGGRLRRRAPARVEALVRDAMADREWRERTQGLNVMPPADHQGGETGNSTKQE